MDNKKIASIFEEMADIFDIKGDSVFKINAYRKAGHVIANFPYDLRDVVAKDPRQLENIPGVGKGLKDKIIELVNTGKCEEHDELRKAIPKGLLELLEIRGIGPKKVKALYLHLKVASINDLKEACEKHKVKDLPGMGEKTENEIMKAISEHAYFSTKRHLISEAMQEAKRIISFMQKCDDVKKIEYAGSLRRRQETIGDIDILVTVKNPKKSSETVMTHFHSYREILTILSKGDTKSSVVLQSGIQVDLRVIDDESFGAALHYFTGSKDHNIKIRDLAKRKGLKISEYGVFKGEKMIAGKTEEEVFKSVGLPYIIPENRYNNGEIEYGLKNKKFPEFIELKDMKGDLHNHTTYSDGKASIEEMAEAFIAKGYEYFAVTDHSSVMAIVNGMSTKDIQRQWKEIDELNKKLKGKIKILKGCEVDILKDGSLDFNDDVLKQLDIVVISAHMYGTLPYDAQTERLLTAIENPYAKILGHPTGRLINKRAPMEFDIEKVIEACVQNNVAIEINSNPSRLDLPDIFIKIAKDKGAKFVIDTDSHSVEQPDFMEYGVFNARRGWLTKDDVLNTKSLGKFDTYF
ncbi:MAG: DNA polymerase/3'-5' exonuclease PolX [Candidatus Peregrinibacteria bacterium]|nr:DNA polymerase/3'-5' exonuclease PolX [Candidatus Peregrinibacteria bacterium]